MMWIECIGRTFQPESLGELWIKTKDVFRFPLIFFDNQLKEFMGGLKVFAIDELPPFLGKLFCENDFNLAFFFRKVGTFGGGEFPVFFYTEQFAPKTHNRLIDGYTNPFFTIFLVVIGFCVIGTLSKDIKKIIFKNHFLLQ